jgi:hypothetical protein
MVYPLAYHQYTYEHGRTGAEQRAADIRAGQVAAELRGLRLRLGRAFRLGHRPQAARRAAGAMTGG